MKFLKSQGIVIVLALIAVLLVGKNLIWPFLKPKFASRPKVPEPPATPASSPAVTQTTSPPGPITQVVTAAADKLKEVMNAVTGKAVETTAQSEPMNREVLRQQASAWTSSPQRDPFKMRGRVSEKPAKDQLTLTGILRQSYSDLAVVNNQVIGKGETILGFLIESIEADRIWVSGPNGKEEVGFKYLVPGPKPAADQITPPAQPTEPSSRAEADPSNATIAVASGLDSSGLDIGEESGHAIDPVESGSIFDIEENSLWGASPVDVMNCLDWLRPVSNVAVFEEFGPFYPQEVAGIKLLRD